jgi:hypothetical protein
LPGQSNLQKHSIHRKFMRSACSSKEHRCEWKEPKILTTQMLTLCSGFESRSLIFGTRRVCLVVL